MPELLKPTTIEYQRDRYWGSGIGSFFAGPYSVDKVNEINKEVIEKNTTEWLNNTERNLKIAREKFQNIPSEVFDHLIEARKAHISEFTEKLAAAHKVHEDPDVEKNHNKRGVAPDQMTVRALTCQAAYEFNKQVDDDVKQKYYASRPNEKHEVLDDQIKRAKIAAGLENQASGSSELFSNIGKAFYDKEKGGIQWGGIAGGIAGYVLSSIFGAGGALGAIIALVMTGIGVYYGNKFADNYKADTLAERAPGVEPERGKGKEKGNDRGTQPEQEQKIPSSPPQPSEIMHNLLYKEVRNRKPASSSHMAEGELGELKSQAFTAVNKTPQALNSK